MISFIQLEDNRRSKAEMIHTWRYTIVLINGLRSPFKRTTGEWVIEKNEWMNESFGSIFHLHFTLGRLLILRVNVCRRNFSLSILGFCWGSRFLPFILIRNYTSVSTLHNEAENLMLLFNWKTTSHLYLLHKWCKWEALSKRLHHALRQVFADSKLYVLIAIWCTTSKSLSMWKSLIWYNLSWF